MTEGEGPEVGGEGPEVEGRWTTASLGRGTMDE